MESQNRFKIFGLDTLKLCYEQRFSRVRGFRVEKLSFLFIVGRYFFGVCILGPADQCLLVLGPVWGPEGCGPGKVWTPADSPVNYCRLLPRPPSPGRSSPFPLSPLCLVSCPCALLCCLSCVLLGVCPCFLHSLISCSLLGFCVFPAARPSQSCVWSCQGVVMSKSCFPRMLYALNPPQHKVLTPQLPPTLSSPNAARVLPGMSWLVVPCGVGWDGIGVSKLFVGED